MVSPLCQEQQSAATPMRSTLRRAARGPRSSTPQCIDPDAAV